MDAGEQDHLDVLADQVERYESAQQPLPPIADGDMLRHLIEARGITQLRLAQETALAESTISNILAGKRIMSRGHVTTLARYFHVSPAVFISRSIAP